jgi:hypothetical protein
LNKQLEKAEQTYSANSQTLKQAFQIQTPTAAAVSVVIFYFQLVFHSPIIAILFVQAVFYDTVRVYGIFLFTVYRAHNEFFKCIDKFIIIINQGTHQQTYASRNVSDLETRWT